MAAGQLSMAVVTKSPGNAARLLAVLRHHDAGGYHVSCMEELETLLSGDEPIHAAFLDVAGFGKEIWTFCEALQRRAVPFFLISGDVAKIEILGLRHGAEGTLAKPISRRLLAELLVDLADRMNGDGNEPDRD